VAQRLDVIRGCVLFGSHNDKKTFELVAKVRRLHIKIWVSGFIEK
jgi:hypothetical protein